MSGNKPPRETGSLIDSLVKDLPNPSESKNWRGRYWKNWSVAFLVIGGITLAAALQLPDFIRLPGEFTPGFLLRSGLWLGVFLICAHISYLWSVPLSNLRLPFYAAATLGIGLIGATWGMASPEGIFAEWSRELHFGQGPCGFFIALTGGVSGILLLRAMKRGVTGSAQAAGFWTLAAGGCLSSFFMNLVCRHENPSHVLIWHTIPIATLTIIGLVIANKVLTRKI